MSIGSDRGSEGVSDRVSIDSRANSGASSSLFSDVDFKSLTAGRDTDALTAASFGAFNSLNSADGVQQRSGNDSGPTAAKVASDTLENGYKDITARTWGDGFAGSNSILAQSDSSSEPHDNHGKKENKENDQDNKERGMASAIFMGLASAEMTQSPETKDAGEQALRAIEARARESIQAPLQGVGNTFVSHSDNQAALAKLRRQGFAI
ncbi:MAG: hypothetical protein K2X93_13260 [Candidatus Obscuribacterales bacterium]|nr:hypothetical protein [Candidatus Obscuribacterales bacterium]